MAAMRDSRRPIVYQNILLNIIICATELHLFYETKGTVVRYARRLSRGSGQGFAWNTLAIFGADITSLV